MTASTTGWRTRRACPARSSYREVGINGLIVDQPSQDQFEVLERFMDDVAPKLRAGV